MSKIWHGYDETPKHQDIIMTDTGCWAYRADLFALETELDRTRRALDVATKVLTSIIEHPEDIGDAMDAEDALNQIKQITEGPAEDAQKKMSPEEFEELELLVNATFK